MKVKARIKTRPCPFCGGEVNITHGMTGAPFWFFKCQKCGATISFDNDECNYNPRQRIILRGEQNEQGGNSTDSVVA